MVQMMESIKQYLWVAEVVLAVLLGVICAVGGWKVAHKDTLLAQSKLDTANGLVAQRDQAIAALEKSTKDAQQEESKAKARVAQAAIELAQFRVDQEKKDKAFSKNTAVIVQRPECAVLKERLCPAAMDY